LDREKDTSEEPVVNLKLFKKILKERRQAFVESSEALTGERETSAVQAVVSRHFEKVTKDSRQT
jgi:hypothetical protein